MLNKVSYIAVISLFLFASGRAVAGPCESYSAESVVIDSDLVVEGVVEDIAPAENAAGKYYATLKVTKLIKGDVKGNVKVLSQKVGMGGVDDMIFEKGRKYLVHARDDGYVGYTTYFNGCRWVQAMEE